MEESGRLQVTMQDLGGDKVFGIESLIKVTFCLIVMKQ